MAAARSAALDAARDEYRRLLYVGMTRAAERLIVCGTKGVNKSPDGCWHQLVLDALKPESTEREDADGRDDLALQQEHRRAGARRSATRRTPRIELPAWLREAAEPKPPALRMLTPSDAGDTDEPHRFATGADRASALLRGSLTHRLLQSLPDIPADKRDAAMQKYLTRAGGELPVEERERIAEEVMRVLADPDFHALYAPGSRAEVPIVGRINIRGETVHVAGQVDRLAVTQSSVLIADFKTNRPAPRANRRRAARLCDAARALSRRARKALPGPACARRPHLDGSP